MSRAKLRRFFRHGLLPQLFVFEAVARLGSVTHAAAELHLAQPTVSLQLKKLAETLEMQLFEQRGRKLHLTSAGYALQEACEELLGLFGRMEEKLERFRSPQAENLRLAAEPEARTVAAGLITAFWAALFLRESLLYNGAGKEEGNGDSAGLQRGGGPGRP